MEKYNRIFKELLDIPQQDGIKLFAAKTNLNFKQATKIYKTLKEQYFNEKEI